MKRPPPSPIWAVLTWDDGSGWCLGGTGWTRHQALDADDLMMPRGRRRVAVRYMPRKAKRKEK